MSCSNNMGQLIFYSVKSSLLQVSFNFYLLSSKKQIYCHSIGIGMCLHNIFDMF
jgi:hypothetical protein